MANLSVAQAAPTGPGSERRVGPGRAGRSVVLPLKRSRKTQPNCYRECHRTPTGKPVFGLLAHSRLRPLDRLHDRCHPRTQSPTRPARWLDRVRLIPRSNVFSSVVVMDDGQGDVSGGRLSIAQSRWSGPPGQGSQTPHRRVRRQGDLWRVAARCCLPVHRWHPGGILPAVRQQCQSFDGRTVGPSHRPLGAVPVSRPDRPLRGVNGSGTPIEASVEA